MSLIVPHLIKQRGRISVCPLKKKDKLGKVSKGVPTKDFVSRGTNIERGTVPLKGGVWQQVKTIILRF